MTTSEVWIVVPAFNEGAVVRETILKLKQHFSNVILVDDSSFDNTVEEALAGGAHVCKHPINLGQGAALQTGIDYALKQGASYIVTYDADGQHSVEDANAMLNRISSGDVDVVLGSRFLGSTIGMPISKRALLKTAVFYTKMTSGLKVSDTHNGLRCLNRLAAQKIKIRHNRMAHASEILNEIGSLRLRYVEMPCTITYTEYSRAKGQRMTGAFAILADLVLGKLYR